MKKARYHTEQQIKDKIDMYRRKAQSHLEAAAALDYKASLLVKEPLCAEEASNCREYAKRKRRSANRITERTLPKLKEKLSEFMTDPILAVIPDGDRSVQY